MCPQDSIQFQLKVLSAVAGIRKLFEVVIITNMSELLIYDRTVEKQLKFLANC